MKTDKLEKFMLENREAFDSFEPDPEVWNRIEKRKPRVISINWKTVASRAAAVVIIFASSWYLHDYFDSRNQSVVQTDEVMLEDDPMYRNLMEAEVYYTSEINNRKDELFRRANNDPMLRNDINNELIELDKVYQELKDDLKDNADNEEVIEAMIQNYRLKLEILEEILYQLESDDEENNDDHENNSIQI